MTQHKTGRPVDSNSCGAGARLYRRANERAGATDLSVDNLLRDADNHYRSGLIYSRDDNPTYRVV